jgi:hypothetical protein
MQERSVFFTPVKCVSLLHLPGTWAQRLLASKTQPTQERTVHHWWMQNR